MLEPGPEPFYGLGVSIYADGFGHDGSVGGYHSQLVYGPDDDVVVVVLSNESRDPSGTALATVIAQETSEIAASADRSD